MSQWSLAGFLQRGRLVCTEESILSVPGVKIVSVAFSLSHHTPPHATTHAGRYAMLCNSLPFEADDAWRRPADLSSRHWWKVGRTPKPKPRRPSRAEIITDHPTKGGGTNQRF